MRNVHKIDTRLIAIPIEAQTEDCGVEYCKVPQLVLSEKTDVTNWKNDRTAFAFKFDSMTVKLVSATDEVEAIGYVFTFPNQPDATGFVIDWRQNEYGCFKVKIEWEIAGVTGWFYYGQYVHRPYTCENANGTVRLFVHLDDFVRKQGINYKGSGFYGTIRFNGFFGFMQPNYDSENIIYSDRVRHKVRIEAIRSYELRTDQLLYAMTRLIDEDVLLTANNILITDHNPYNHSQEFKDFPVVLSDSESPKFEYSNPFSSITAVFNEKVAVSESRYSSDINAPIPIVQTVVTTTPDATIEVNGNTFGTVSSGGTIDIPVVNGGSNPVGTIDGGQVVIGDSLVQINGTTVGDIVAEDSLSIAVELDGVPAGSWNAGAQTWEIDSTPCADATITLDSEPFLTLPSGSITNITLQDEEGNPIDPVGSVGSAIVVQDGTVQINDITVGTVTSGDTLDLTLVDQNGDDVPFTQTGNELEVQTGGGTTEWVRPSDWLPIPTITPTEQVFYGLCAVYQDRANLVSLRFTGNYTVDWGDGVVENFASNVVAHHQYSWSSVGNVTSEGFRQALIKVTPQAGQNLTGINLQFKHPLMGGGNGKSSIFIDMVMNLPKLIGLGNPIVFGQLNGVITHSSCQRVRIDSIGSCNTLANLCINFFELQKFEIGDTTNVTSMSAMFQSCLKLTAVPLFNTQNVTNMSYMFQNCYTLTSVPLFNTQNVTNMTNMFFSCNTLQSVPLFNTTNVTNMTGMFQYCVMLKSTNLNLSSVSVLANTFSSTGNIETLILSGCRYAFNIANNEMSASALNALFTSLGTAVGAQTITITGNPGAPTCNTTIATSKGFTVVI